jgi:hypothetical protein
MVILFSSYVWDQLDEGKLELSRLSMLHFQISTIAPHCTSLGYMHFHLLYQTNNLSFGIL